MARKKWEGGKKGGKTRMIDDDWGHFFSLFLRRQREIASSNSISGPLSTTPPPSLTPAQEEEGEIL